MRTPLLALLLAAPGAAAAQNTWFDAPGHLLFAPRDGSRPAMAGGVFRPGDKVTLRIVNTSDKPLYYSIVDLQPDNVLNILAPSARGLRNNRVAAHDTARFADVVITPPYGIDKVLVAFSENPVDFHEVAQPARSGANPLLQQVQWILAGTPAPLWKNCRFSFTDLAIIPVSKTSAAPPAPQPHGWAARAPRFDDACGAARREPEKLYSVYPLISLVQPLQAGATRGVSAGHSVHSRAFVLKGTAVAQKGIRSVLVNGEQGQLRLLTEQQCYWEKEVALKPGTNTFQVQVETADGHLACEPVTVDYTPEGGTATAGADHLLLLGINDYVQWPRLTGARRDVDSLEALLTGRFGFAPANVHKLTDAACTKEGIDSVFRALIGSLGPADNLVVYFAGHGTLDRQVNEGYWIPVDARLRKPIDYLSNTEIKKYLEALKTHHVLLLADACFSGGFFKTNRGESFAEKMDRLGSRWVLCSGREEEVADVLPGTGHSPFAYYLLRFLREAPPALTASQLFQEVKVAVAANAAQTPIGGPVSNVGDEGGEFVFHKTNR